MKQAVRKPRPTILARWDQGNGRMVYTVKSTSRRASYLVVSINFIVESCECGDHVYRHRDCKHICAVQWAEEDRRIEVERARAEEQAKAELAAKMAAYDVVAEAENVAAEADRLHSIEEVVEHASSLVQQIERDSAEDAYAELGETKKVSVPPTEYASCALCGCRVADGQTYCKRC